MTISADTITAIRDAAALRAAPHLTPTGGQAFVLPQGYSVKELPPIDPLLTFIKQAVTFHDSDSFCSYVNEFKGRGTRLFAEPGFLSSGGAHVTAVFDYHEPTAFVGRCAHVAKYVPRHSEQWERWTKVCAAAMKQAEFAEFVEETRADIRAPDAAKLLDIVRTFKASRKVDFDSVTYQPNGDVVLNYSDKTEQKGTSGALPETMTLGIPVYFRGTVYAVPMFIRYRVGGGAVGFQLKMDRADVIEDAAFGELSQTISEAVSMPVHLGRRGD